MTDPVPSAPSGPPWAAASAPPGPALAAAVTTITAAGVTAMVVLVFAVGGVFVGRSLLEFFDDRASIVGWFVGVVGALLALCSFAVVASVGLLRRRRWAWWALLVLSPVTAVLGVVTAAYLAPFGVAAAASAVFVLLLLPSTRAWIAAPADSR